MIPGKWPTWRTILFYVFISILYMFRYNWFSWLWERGCSKHVENWNKYIEKKCASSWSFTRNRIFGSFWNKYEFRRPAVFPSSDKRKAGPHSVGAILSTRNQRQIRVKLSKIITQTVKNNLGEFFHDDIYVSGLKRFPLFSLPTIYHDLLAFQWPSYLYLTSREGRRTSSPIYARKYVLAEQHVVTRHYYWRRGYFLLHTWSGKRSSSTCLECQYKEQFKSLPPRNDFSRTNLLVSNRLRRYMYRERERDSHTLSTRSC
jgi:hypothetical protein